ncbi:MAG: DNA translocase FtsK [Candidatus Loosdrechtia sp.]|uniref:DNA translocase FtsK n=1 Tax=Candidatus Loosdrechtia sp. TaxID=3101272 RepID=UPI003A717BF5|nr:MAG: DNA translocase FtsK [Candidatus Jettenia sp. AMX2]
MGIKYFIHCVTSVILIAVTLFILISFLSYSSNDPPFADYPVNEPVRNFCGKAGAQVAGYAMEGLGKTSYLIVVLMGLLGGVYLYKKKIEYVWVKAIGTTLLLFSVASLLTLLCYVYWKSFLSYNPGGIFGIVIVSRLYEYFNLTGTLIILGSGFAISVMLILNATPLSPFLRISLAKKNKPASPNADKNSGSEKPETKVRSRTKDADIKKEKRDGYSIPAATADKDEPGRFFGDNHIPLEPKENKGIQKIQQPSDRKGDLEEDTEVFDVVTEGEPSYKLPPLNLLEKPDLKQSEDDWDQVTQRAVVLKNALEQFNIKSEVVAIERGPVITMYELELAPGTKVGKLVSLSDDLAIALKSPSVRIVAPLLGKSSIGVEVPNVQRKTVMLREILEASDEMRKKMAIPLSIGKDVAGNPVISDLAAMPHLLIAGTTGSGKSVCLNSIILSILFLRHPSDIQLLLVDPKMVEFSMFREIPHLISPVVTDMKRAAAVLEWAVNKMEERYALLASAGVKHINGYNRLGMAEIRKRLNPEGDASLDDVPFHLPHIVIIVDELADLMMVASKEVEGSVIRLSQKSRAVGIHLILATQRPSVDVITGLIKSNLPSRISFYVASKVDSRTILDQNGAEKLLGGGDMLFLPPGTSKLVRVQGTYVSDEEVKSVVDYLKKCATPRFNPELKVWKGTSDNDNRSKDNLYNDAVRIVLETQRGSVSLLQRRLEIGYSRAAKLIDMMAEDGIVGEYKGSQAREVFLTLEDWDVQMAHADMEEMDNT